MIDFVSMTVANTAPEILLNNPCFNWSQTINPNTAEQVVNRYNKIVYRAKFEEFSLLILTDADTKDSIIRISGSLHKFYKGGNEGDFSYYEICTAVDNLSKILNVTPENLMVHKIECGVNTSPPIKTYSLIDQMLCFRRKEFEVRNFRSSGYMKSIQLSNFKLKVYDKGMHCKSFEPICRIELNAEKMQFLHDKGVNLITLSDLKKLSLYSKLKEILLSQLNKVIFTDDRINAGQIDNPEEREFYLMATNSRFWQKSHSEFNGMRYLRTLERFEALKKEYAPDDLKEDFIKRVSAKWDSLSGYVTKLPITETSEMLRNYLKVECNIYPRVCLNCGRDISTQRDNSFYCSEKLHGRKVKRCRNEVSNLKVHELRFYPGETLFEIDSFLKPEYRRLKEILKNHNSMGGLTPMHP
jgi:hypothetical protein